MPIIPASELPIDRYHQCAPGWLSKTSLRDFIDHGPAWFYKAYIGKSIKREAPGGVEQGSALDCLMTEGKAAFAARYVIKPDDYDGRTSAGKAWRLANEDKQHLTAKDFAILGDAADAVRLDPVWQDLEKATAQLTVRRSSESLGLGLQSRPDFLALDRGAIYWDLKKTRDLDLFGKQAINLGYHLQAAVARWCLAGEGIAMGPAYLVAVEWEHGARCRVFEIPEWAIDDGERQMRAAAADIADRVKRDDWTNKPMPVSPLDIPEWMRRQMDAA